MAETLNANYVNVSAGTGGFYSLNIGSTDIGGMITLGGNAVINASTNINTGATFNLSYYNGSYTVTAKGMPGNREKWSIKYPHQRLCF